ncbi:MAG: Do family serine endopeptidase [Flavobacteriaceae bacterium]|nr:Do family serine endopeptidase [Flavobacteriaceae bacterium]
MDIKRGLSLLAIASLGGLVALGINRITSPERSNTFEEKQKAWFTGMSAGKMTDMPDFVGASAMVTPTVVHIKTTATSKGGGNQFEFNDPFGFFGDKAPYQMPQGPHEGSGSGVILTNDGYIVTNNHVIDGADKIEVILNDKRSYVAELVGKDNNVDLALIKIEEKGLPFIQFGNSDDTKVGEWVLAVGNPFNLTSTVTAGIVSAKGRNIRLLEGDAPIEAFIQTDAAVNPGNSGGALVNRAGQLIGINTAIASSTGSYAGYAFAVPVELVKKVVQDFKDFGEVQRGFLGIQIRDVDSKLADEKGLKEISGVFVAEVNDGSAAEKAGVQKDDVITKVNGLTVNSVSELQEQVSRHRPGETLKISAMRGSTPKEFSVVLKGKNGKTTVEETAKSDKSSLKGSEFVGMSREEKLKAKVQNGVKVSKAGGALAKAGITTGFIITQIDKKPVYTPQDVKKAMEDRKDVALVSGVMPDGTKKHYALSMEE